MRLCLPGGAQPAGWAGPARQGEHPPAAQFNSPPVRDGATEPHQSPNRALQHPSRVPRAWAHQRDVGFGGGALSSGLPRHAGAVKPRAGLF